MCYLFEEENLLEQGSDKDSGSSLQQIPAIFLKEKENRGLIKENI